MEEKREVYLDNSATTKPCQEAIDAVMNAMTVDYGNPSSMHQKGVDAENIVRRSTEKLAAIMKVDPATIYYTSGASESNNWALFGTALANQRRGKHIIVSPIEHAAVSMPAKALEEMGFEVTTLSVDAHGHIDLEELKHAIRKDTILVSIMYVNNEVGTVEPIRQLATLIHSVNPDTYFHVDAVQAFGKFFIHPKREGIDLMSASSHKFSGPKGVGFLYIDPRVKIKPLVYGGGQQNDMRSGTDNVPGIAGMAAAAERVYATLKLDREKIIALKKKLAAGAAELGDIKINGDPDMEGTAPHILNVSFLGIRSEVMLHSLEEKGIYVSAGSACSSHKRHGSPTLNAIGCSQAEKESAVRFSLSSVNTAEDINYTLEALKEIVPRLRKYMRY